MLPERYQIFIGAWPMFERTEIQDYVARDARV